MDTMTQPCSEKESIEKLFDFHHEKINKLHDIELRQLGIQKDVITIRTKIENGMTNKIDDTHDVVLKLVPVIEHHSLVISKIENMGWLISRTLSISFLLTLLGLVAWAISKGFLPKI